MSETRDEMRECPYPKCGSDDREHDLWVAQNGTGPDDWSTGCACCGMTGPVMPSRKEAIDAWNERPRPAPAATLRSQVMALAALKDGWYDGEGTAYDPTRLAAVAGLLERLAGIAGGQVYPVPSGLSEPSGLVRVEWGDRPRDDSLEIDPVTLAARIHLYDLDSGETLIGEIMPESPAEARPRVGEATREVIKFLAWVANDSDPRLGVMVRFGGIKEHLGIDRINAAAAEIGEQP